MWKASPFGRCSPDAIALTSLPVLLADGVDLVDEPRSDEDRALLADADRTGSGDAGREDLDLEAGRGLELCDRQLVGGRRDRRGRNRREPHRARALGAAVERGSGRRRGLRGGRSRRGSGRGGRLRLGRQRSEITGNRSGDGKGAKGGAINQHGETSRWLT